MVITAVSYPPELREIYEKLRELSAPEIYELLVGLSREKKRELEGMMEMVPISKEVCREIGSNTRDGGD